MSLEEEKEVD